MKTWTTNETKYSRMAQINFFKGCLPEISLGPFLNTLPKYNDYKLGANLNKRKRSTFVIKFVRNFEIFVKNLIA